MGLLVQFGEQVTEIAHATKLGWNEVDEMVQRTSAGRVCRTIEFGALT